MRIVTDGDAAIDENMVAESGPGADHAVGADEDALPELRQRRNIGRRMNQCVVAEAEASIEFRRQIGTGRRGRAEQIKLFGRRLKIIQQLHLRCLAQTLQSGNARRQRNVPLARRFRQVQHHLDRQQPVGQRAVEQVGNDVAGTKNHQPARRGFLHGRTPKPVVARSITGNSMGAGNGE